MFNIYLNFDLRDKKIIVLKNSETEIDQIEFSDDNSVGAMDLLLKRNNLSIDGIEFADFKEDASSFTGARLACSISNVINLYKGRLKNYADIKLPKYSSEPNLTWSSKNT